MESKDLVDILSVYSPKLLSNGQIRMECPHRENHKDGSGKMSFFISPEINAYHCFSCKEHGNLVRLLTTHFHVNYFEVVKLVKLTDYVKEKKEFDLDIIWDVRPPRPFLRRGFTRETLAHFKLGVSTDGWMIIPFYWAGKLIGYQKRKDSPDRVVINSEGFNKRTFLYNYSKKWDYVIVVEGYSDVMRLHQFGYNATAVLGATTTEEQAKLLSDFKKVYLAFDNDLAGRMATEQCYHQIKNHTEVELIPYTTKDPGECGDKAEWDEYFSQATSYAEYSLSMAMEWDGYLDLKEKVLQELERKKKFTRM